LWRICAMKDTPSPARGAAATVRGQSSVCRPSRQRWRNKRCRCYDNSPVNSPPPSRQRWRNKRFPLWRIRGQRCWHRQPAVVYKAGGALCDQSVQWEVLEARQKSVQWVLVEARQKRVCVWAVWYSEYWTHYECAVWIVKSPNRVKSSSYKLSGIEWMERTTSEDIIVILPMAGIVRL
jgi:hypothetical protein